MAQSREIGHYQIRRELGRTGMSTVYLAYDIQFRRYVAIKILLPQLLDDPAFLIRFRHEARLIASLEHHAIVPVYDYGEHEGQPYLVMRYMAGGTLRDQLQQGPLPLSEVCRIVDRISAALEKAHGRGIIHRDIKTGNVLFDEDGEPYLSDFGSARMMASAQTGSFIGTPPYMAPEQWAGEKVDARTDVYQLGAMLFELLTGRIPFEADTPPALMYKHIHCPVPSARALDPRLPSGCDSVIRRAMAKRPPDRYAGPDELAAALRAAVRSSVALPEGGVSPRLGGRSRGLGPALKHAVSRLPRPWWIGLGSGVLLFSILLLASRSLSVWPFEQKTPTAPATPFSTLPAGISPPAPPPPSATSRPPAPTATFTVTCTPTETATGPPGGGPTVRPTPTRVPTRTPRPAPAAFSG